MLSSFLVLDSMLGMVMADWKSAVDAFFTGLAVVLAMLSVCFPTWVRRVCGVKAVLSVFILLYVIFSLYVFFFEYLDLEANFFAYLLGGFLIFTLGAILGFVFEFVRWLYLRLVR